MDPTATRPSTEEEVALAKASRGDGAAFEWLVRRYQERVYNTVYRMCRHEADALDLTQAAFLKAYESLPRFEGRSSFYTWLFRIAVNLVLSHRRRAPRPTTTADTARVEARCGDDPQRIAAAAEEEQRIAAALARVPDEFRAAVVLRDVEGMDYAAIGEVLGVPVGTVKSRIARGRAVLRDLLGAEEIVS